LQSAEPFHLAAFLNHGYAVSLFKDADFEAFERLIAEVLQQFSVDLIAYQWMSNHWHMVLSPQVDGGMFAFIGWVTTVNQALEKKNSTHCKTASSADSPSARKIGRLQPQNDSGSNQRHNPRGRPKKLA